MYQISVLYQKVLVVLLQQMGISPLPSLVRSGVVAKIIWVLDLWKVLAREHDYRLWIVRSGSHMHFHH